MCVNPHISIIVPVYNVAPYLRECLDSILVQTFGDWEALCVDDGSTDGSGAILDEYAMKDGRIKVFHTVNCGVSAARNLGIDMASGEYVTFLDGDDVYEEFWLAGFWRIIKETGAELVRQRVKSWDGGLYKILPVADDPCWDCFVGDDLMAWGLSTYTLEGWSWLNAIKRSCLNGIVHVRFSVGMKFMEDNIFMLKILPLIHMACQGNIVGYLYRQRATSVCGGTRNARSVVRLFDEVAQLCVSMSVENKKCISLMLGRSILDWRGHRERCENDGAGIVRNCIINSLKDSIFHVSALPTRWRLGFNALVFFHSFLVMDLLLFLQRCWGCARRLIVHSN